MEKNKLTGVNYQSKNEQGFVYVCFCVMHKGFTLFFTLTRFFT